MRYKRITMGIKKQLLLLLCIASSLQTSYGQCQIGDFVLGHYEQQTRQIQDIFRGTIISSPTTNIDEIVTTSYGGGLENSPSYLDITHTDSVFTVQTSTLFAQYEENETVMSIPVTINFRCTGGSTSTLLLFINIEDTNNNYPEFLPTNEFEFVLAPPLPPGFLITGCLNEITVKDIDLTTSSIIFEIEDNPFFQIGYDAVASEAAGPKHFKAILSTTTFIRTLNETITLRITATDVDATGDPPLSASGIIRISGDTEFEFPEEPVFSQTLYFATYTDEHQLILHDTISLRQGFDENVLFSLDGEYRNYFNIIPEGNEVTLVVITSLPEEVLVEKQIYLIVRADKEYTSGDTATIVVTLPEEIPLLFESALYEGSIIDNTLQLPPLVLSQGYSGSTVSAHVLGDYSSSFTANVQENLVIITMSPLTNSIVENNTFISLPVVASTERSEATSIVLLEIIKEDNVTPLFDESIYTGSYDPVNGLRLGQITFVQGYDEIVSIELHGEHKDFFSINRDGFIVQISSSEIPLDMIDSQQIILSIEASKPRTVGARAAIIINLPAPRELAFEELIYRGTIFYNELTLETILLSDGYDENVQFTATGDYRTYFNVSNVQNQVNIDLLEPLPEIVIAQNTDITLTLSASGLNAIPTTTTILFNLIKEDTSTPVFNQMIYQGTYNGPTNFEIGNIFLTQGFDEHVTFTLDDSEHAQYFFINNTDNMATIHLASAIPDDLIFNEKVLIFNVLANKPLTVGSHATVIIRFSDEVTALPVLEFSENYYVGALEENEISFSENIILSTGNDVGTEIELFGGLNEYFQASLQGAAVIVRLRSPIPEQSVPANRIIVLEIQASAPQTTPAHATLVIEYVVDDDVSPVVELIFAQPYYTGTYSDADGLAFPTLITLTEEYDTEVQFTLVGDDSQWFTLIGTGNSQELSLLSPIPAELLQNNRQLIFVVEAQLPGSTTAAATIIISLEADYTEGSVLQFDQISYRGSLEENQLTTTPITLSEGIVPGVQITLHGGLNEYFEASLQGAAVIVRLRSPIPEQSVPANRIIVLEIQASAPQITPAHATLVIEYVVDDDVSPVVELIFAQPYYTGTYSDADGLAFPSLISLTEGYGTDVQFSLVGDDSRWFTLIGTGNSQELSLLSPIPAAVLQNNRQLVFVVEAQRPGSTTASATIVISLEAEYTEGSVLGFDQISYRGSLEDDQLTTVQITLSEGIVPGVQITLHGGLNEYFEASLQGAAVIVRLRSPIPEQSVPANRIIVLEIQASAPQTTPAHATLVIEYVVDDDVSPVVELIFAQPYYTGTYSDADGLAFPSLISLIEGYGTDVQFSLVGDDSRWFTLIGTGNSQELSLLSPIPAAVLQNNRQLVFVVEAQRSGSTTASATIVISLEAEYTEGSVLGFDQISYRGSLENDQLTTVQITLSEGIVPGVQITLHGGLNEYFEASLQGAAVIVRLRSPIPEQSVPANRIIVLEIQASAPQTTPAHATLVIEYVVDDDVSPVVELIFAQPYYTGTYSDADGLAFPTLITLTEEYDTEVQFTLVGDDSQWFTLIGTGNSQELSLLSPIPAELLQNNRQLIFVVEAQLPGSTTAAATIIISLEADYTEGSVLQFDQISYRGSLEENQLTTTPITLSEGIVPGVQITLHGGLNEYFEASLQGAAVIVRLRSPIPEQSVPANRIIVLEIQASAPQTTPAHATLVIEYVVDDDVSPVVELIFAQPYYTGTYSDADGLAFPTLITLTEEYDTEVQFTLVGDDSQWFTLIGTGNSQELSLLSPIPAELLQNNRQLIFVVEAQLPGSTTAAATIIISLEADYTEGSVLQFDQISYRGSLEENQLTTTPITLSEGIVPGVQITLHGGLNEYFEASLQGAAVIVRLRSPIPEQSVPANRIIVLEIQASAPQTTPAHATLVIEYVVDDDVSPVVELIFAQPYYTGTYSDADGLAFPSLISLIEGYGTDVQFSLVGDDSWWFTLIGTGNSKELSLLSPIPAAVLQNNRQLVFVVEAQRSGSTTASATIVISLEAEYTEGSVLGFDQISYRGSLENDQLTTVQITLSEGIVPGVQITLHGGLNEYFEASLQGAAVIVRLRSPIPEQSVPANRIIVLEIQASAPQTTPAHATLVIEYVVDDDVSPVVELIFAQPYYTGTYSDADGLAFPSLISLIEGYGTDVQFSLVGDDSRWFTLIGTGNSQELSLLSPIPAAVLQNNRQLVFVVEAQRSGSTTASATIVISLEAEYTEGSVLGFDQISYRGSLEDDQLTTVQITLSEGIVPGVQITLHGGLNEYFEASLQGAAVIVRLRSPIPEQSVPANRIIVLEIQASAPQTTPAHATLVIEYVVDDDVSPVVELIFAQPYYTGTYSDADGLAFPSLISLIEGYGTDVQFSLVGDDSRWFTLIGTGNSQELSLLSPIPAAVLQNNRQLVFVVEAQRSGSTTASATIVISLEAEYTEGSVLGFDQISYRGSLEDDQLTTVQITLSEGIVPGVQITLHGGLNEYFEASLQGAAVIVRLRSPIPEQSVPANRIIVLEIQASAPQTTPAHATLVIEYVVDDDVSPVVELIFAQPYYTGTYSDADGLAFPSLISLIEGYGTDVQFSLVGDDSRWFTLIGTGNSQELSLLSPIPAAVLQNNRQLVFVVEAQRSGSTTASATIVISLEAEYTEGSVLGFDQISYRGSLENDQLTTVQITLSEGIVPGVQITLHGGLNEYFEASLQGAAVIVRLRSPIPEQSVPANRIIVLEIQASAPQTTPAHATLVIEYVVDDDVSPVVELIFAQPYYTGTYSDADGLAFPTLITLTEEYDTEVQFTLVGDDSQWFTLIGTGNSQELSLLSPIPAAVLQNNRQLVFVVEAQRPGSTTASATIVISLTDSQTESGESFEKVLFEGVIRNGDVSHETIRITGFDGSRVELEGVHSSLFEAELNNGVVTVNAVGSLTLPAQITHLPLELRAASAAAVLLLDISQSEVPAPVEVTFSSPSYIIRVDITDTGVVGQVAATADSGEALRYSLQLDNVHLQERLSINEDGTLYLSAPVNSGTYTFQVVATTIFTEQTGTATIFLTSEAITVCGDDYVIPPLIVIDRDEEEPHYNLIDLTEGCHFSLTNRWPLDQMWVYVNETGLHTRAIDREDPSIAFMTLSQVQVEIILYCDTDETRVKRSLTYDSPDPYDYGSNKWVLADTIPYNSRRSLVNLIVNDINDNAPIFLEKEREPIVVGYPVYELEDRVLPRSLAELQATDADIGENAALVYWSLEPSLAVSPSTGFVHIRDGARLENNALLRVSATDRNGDVNGLTGSIDIVVKLLNENNILVVTVRDEFLNNEADVLTRMSESLGYEIKVLTSVVISEEDNEEATRKKRDVSSATGASLQLYIYGLIDREPVSTERLITDINNAEVAQVNIAKAVSLEDHLAGQEICVIPGRDTGLLAATIVLSVLLFIVLVLIAVWFFLRWKRQNNYDQFNDADSLTSQNEPKPLEVAPKPRLNIEELIKSEKRLQEMLDAPIENVSVKPTSSRKDAVVNIPPSPDTNIPIVIQSMDKLKAANDELWEDEFGEGKSPKPKPVVTFNENVQKIIHVEDTDVEQASPSTDYEIYKF